MQRRLANLSLVVLVGAIIMPVLAVAPSPQPVNAAEGFASPAFRTLWTRTDLPVEDLSVKRSWLWGPQPLNTLQEPYSDSPGGQRQVQYFDKSRMEINNPAANAVTNGLLATELIKGELQVGDTPRETKESALVNVAGDSDDLDGPVYASLTGLLDQPAAPVGSTLTETLNRDGSTDNDPSKAGFGVTAVNLVSETNHSVASVFWDYLQTTGPVVVGNARRDEKLFEPWYAAVGLPISRAYWAKVKVAGKVQDVLIQAFQRRVLTFTPANPDGFKVEMGNIGRHYYIWRYGEEPTPAGPGTPAPDFVPLSGPHIGYGFNGFFQFTPVSDPNQTASLRRSLDLVKEAEFSWIRKQIVWATLEPFPGQYDIEQLAAYDAIVREAAERKIGIMFSVAKAPRWAVPGDEFCHDGGGVKLCGLPRDPQVLARLMGFLANRYKDGSEFGRVRAWEVWNEQNTGGETGNNVDVGVYVEALKASYRTIKNADSKAIVVFGGLTPTGVNDKRLAIDDVTYLEQVYQYNGGEVKRYFDVMGAHPGSNNNPPDAFLPNNPGPGTGREGTPCHAERSCWKNHPSFYFRRIEQVRAVMEKYGDAQYGNRLKQIWLTEFGWSTKNEAPGYEYGDVISEELQAQYIVRAFEKGQKDYPWMGVMFLWTLNHSVVVPPSDEKYPWSVLRGDWSPRPAYEAVKNMPKP